MAAAPAAAEAEGEAFSTEAAELIRRRSGKCAAAYAGSLIRREVAAVAAGVEDRVALESARDSRFAARRAEVDLVTRYMMDCWWWVEQKRG